MAELKGCEVQTVCVYVNCFCDQPKLICLFSNYNIHYFRQLKLPGRRDMQLYKNKIHTRKFDLSIQNFVTLYEAYLFFYPYLFKTDKHFLLYLFKYFSCKITTDKYATLSYCELVYVLSAHGK